MIRFAIKINRGVGQKVIFHSEGGGGLRQKVTLHDMGGSEGQAKSYFSYDNGCKEVKKIFSIQRVARFFFTISRAVLSLKDSASIGLLTMRVGFFLIF